MSDDNRKSPCPKGAQPLARDRLLTRHQRETLKNDDAAVREIVDILLAERTLRKAGHET